MAKQNCWEFKQCGRQPGGKNAEELGICPASISALIEGTNDGVMGGRACWALTGTLCGAKVQGTFAGKLSSCQNCEFYEQVMCDQEGDFEGTVQILKKLK